MQTTQLLLTGIIVLASFAGGLVSVLIGQFLSYYREQRQEIEELHLVIENIHYLPDKSYPYSYEADDIDRLNKRLQESYLQNEWWMSDELTSEIRTLIHTLDAVKDAKTTLSKIRTKKANDDEVSDIVEDSSIQELKEDIENNIERGEEIAHDSLENIMSEFSRIPIHRFIPRYLGFLS